jgi:hypothetical protein
VTKHIRDEDMHPFGHVIRRGSTLHRKHRAYPIAHDIDVLLGQAERGEQMDIARASRHRRVHQHGRTLHDPATHGGGHSKAVQWGNRR